MTDILTEFFKEKDVEYKKDVNLSQLSTVKIGGIAKYAVYPDTEEKLICVVAYLSDAGLKYRVVGGMSNLLPKDSYYDGVIVRTDRLCMWNIEADTVNAACGCSIAAVGSALAGMGLSGFEELCGIPGRIGGLVYNNAGANGKEIADSIISARIYDTVTKSIKSYTKEELKLSYRHSVLYESKNLILLSAAFRLQHDFEENIRKKIECYAKKRKQSQPLCHPSLGSVFKRPDGYFAGDLIEKAGLKGLSIGGAEISEKHAGFIVNKGGAKAEDFISLAAIASDTVYKKFGVKLEMEVEILE